MATPEAATMPMTSVHRLPRGLPIISATSEPTAVSRTMICGSIRSKSLVIDKLFILKTIISHEQLLPESVRDRLTSPPPAGGGKFRCRNFNIKTLIKNYSQFASSIFLKVNLYKIEQIHSPLKKETVRPSAEGVLGGLSY